jgi:hypothetical protein
MQSKGRLMNWTKTTAPDLLSRIGGGAQGGSAKPPEERRELDRKHDLEQPEGPASAGGAEVPPTAWTPESDEESGEAERTSSGRQNGR